MSLLKLQSNDFQRGVNGSDGLLTYVREELKCNEKDSLYVSELRVTQDVLIYYLIAPYNDSERFFHSKKKKKK